MDPGRVMIHASVLDVMLTLRSNTREQPWASPGLIEARSDLKSLRGKL